MLDKLISLFDPNTLLGAIGIDLCALFIATAIAILIRRFTLRVEARMSDVTVLRFISMVAQLSTYLIALVLYAHLIPPLRAIGTALLAGASVLSVVAGLAEVGSGDRGERTPEAQAHDVDLGGAGDVGDDVERLLRS